MVVRQSLRDDAAGLAAELAYRWFLALFPFAIFVVSASGWIAERLGIADPSQQVVDAIGDALPAEASTVLAGELQRILSQRSGDLLSLGAVFALITATGGTNALIKAMTRAYSLDDRRPIWRRYLVAMALTLLAGAAILGSFTLVVPVRLAVDGLQETLGLGTLGVTVIGIGTIALALVVITAAAAVVYRIAPDIRLEWRLVLPGAIVFSVGWLMATGIFSLFVTRLGNYAATYGALAGVAILLIWFYLTGLLAVVGAEVNEVLHRRSDPTDLDRRRGHADEPDDQPGGPSFRSIRPVSRKSG